MPPVRKKKVAPKAKKSARSSSVPAVPAGRSPSPPEIVRETRASPPLSSPEGLEALLGSAEARLGLEALGLEDLRGGAWRRLPRGEPDAERPDWRAGTRGGGAGGRSPRRSRPGSAEPVGGTYAEATAAAIAAHNDALARLEREALPLPGGQESSELLLLRKNVRSMYEDARTHILQEKDSAKLLVDLRTQVGTLQRAFRSLAEAVCEELEQLRDEFEQQGAPLSRVGAQDAEIRTLRLELERVGRLCESRQHERDELQALRREKTEADKKMRRLQDEIGELRAQATHDRATVEKAVRALHAATVAADERQAKGDAEVGLAREAVAGLDMRQRALDEEVGELGDALARATVGGVPYFGRSKPRSWPGSVEPGRAN